MPKLSVREILALKELLSKTAAQEVPRTKFIAAAKQFLDGNGWHTVDLSKEGGDKSQRVTQAFVELTDAMYTSQDQLVRAMTRPEIVDIVDGSGRLGIDKAKPQIRWLKDSMDPAEHLILNNSMNMFATAHSKEDVHGKVNIHAMLYAAEYTKLHGLKGSFMTFLARPLVFLTQKTTSRLYPYPYTMLDKTKQSQDEPGEFKKLTSSCFEDAQKPEVTVITGLPGTTIDWRPTVQDVLGFLSVNTIRKIARFFKPECTTRGNQAGFVNEEFAPHTFSIEVVGSRHGAPTLVDVATENAHMLDMIPPTARPIVVEDILQAVPTLQREFPRLQGRAHLGVRAEVEVLGTVPLDIKRKEITEYLVEQHRPQYDAQKDALKKAKALHLDGDHSNPFSF